MRSEKLKWERADGGFDLICRNPDQLNMKDAKELLRKVDVKYEDYKRPFAKKASRLWREWIKDPRQPLQEAAYCLLSNWFLTEDPAASISIRAGLTLLLWRKLFCAIPDIRFTDWEISGGKVIPERFNRWWQEQVKCQDDC
jgi:hypothetical protein